MAESIQVLSAQDAHLPITRFGARDESNDTTLSIIAAIAIHAFALMAWPPADVPTVQSVEAEQIEIFTLEIADMPPPEVAAVEPAREPLGTPLARSSKPSTRSKPSGPLGLPVLPDLPVPESVPAEPALASVLPVPDLPDFDVPPVKDIPLASTSKRASGATGAGGASVAGGSGTGPWSDYVAFSPVMVKPEIRNREEVRRFLERRFQPILRKTGATGVVMLAFWIDEKGKAQRAEIVSSSGHVELDDIAMLLSDVIRFSPAIHMGSPVRVRVEVPIRFQERS